MTNNAPQFSPAKGVGTKYKDGSGLDWVYTNTGWVESGKETITDPTKKDTFNVKPDEDPMFTTLKTNGAKDADIQAALKNRQEILATNADYGLGNIDLNNRPIVNDKAGEIITSKTTVPGDWSTLHSVSFNIDGKETLIPRVKQGLDRLMTNQEALDWYKKTGEYLGKFDSVEEANKYALKLHEDQAKQYDNSSSPADPSTDPVIETTIGKKTTDPFKGKTRSQVLNKAFLDGVTDVTELKKIGETYDLLATPEAEANANIDKLSPVEQEIAKKSIEKQAVLKIQSLPDATGRDSALTSLSIFRTGKDIIDILDAGTVETGLVKNRMREGVFGVGGRSLGKTTAEEDAFAALTEVFAANFRKAMSGTAVSEPEMKRLDKFLPSEKKTKQANIQGIIQLSNYLSDKTSLQLNYDLSPLTPKESTEDPLNVKTGLDPKNNPLGI